MKHDSLFGRCRVLDLTDETGHLCGKVLGDFGADVIKIEKPGGDSSRNIGPFFNDIPDPEKSLFWFATNTSKRGITLDIEAPEGREIFKRLAGTADLVVESSEPGYMDGLGLGYADLKAVRPGIIMTSITPFGQTGPYAQYKATDLVGSAMGGLVRILGNPGRPPVRMSCDPQAYFHAGIHGALGSAVAYYHRELSGEGQHVDVSMQEAVTLALMSTVEIYQMMKATIVGTGQAFVTTRRPPLGRMVTRLILPCKDGFVFFSLGGGAFGGQVQSSKALVAWANEEGMATELKDFDFSHVDSSTQTQEESDHRYSLISAFLKSKTKADLYEGAVKRGIMLAPCSTIEDVSLNAQLKAHGFWVSVEHPELNETLTYPGAPAKIDDAPWKIRRRPPLIGEHNEEVYAGEMGFSREQMAVLKANGVI